MLLYILNLRGGEIMEHLLSKKNKNAKKAIHTIIVCEDYTCMNACGDSCYGKLIKVQR